MEENPYKSPEDAEPKGPVRQSRKNLRNVLIAVGVIFSVYFVLPMLMSHSRVFIVLFVVLSLFAAYGLSRLSLRS